MALAAPLNLSNTFLSISSALAKATPDDSSFCLIFLAKDAGPIP